MPRFRDIPEFVTDSKYAIDVSWRELERALQGYQDDYNLDLIPDFQRGHVWSCAQQSAYIEYVLQGGPSGRDIYFNCPSFNDSVITHPMELVDGLQRITAVLNFLENKVFVFGSLFNDYTDKLMYSKGSFRFHVNTLKTRAEVLKWYLLFNAGGTPHSKKEIERVKALLAAEELIATGK